MRERDRNGGVRRGPARVRGQRGAVPVRVLLALASSTCVTALVAGPMAYQASQADERPATTSRVATSTTLPPSSSTSTPPTSTPLVAGTTLDRPSVALPAPTTSAPPRTTLRTPTTRPSGSPPATAPNPAPTTPAPSVFTTTTAPPSSTTRPPISGDGIVWARKEARDALVPLEGATVTGRVWVYYEDAVAARVSFWVDDPDGTGPPRNVENEFPFTLVPGPTNGQPASLDTRGLADGPHSVRAEAVGPNGAVLVRVARFTVDN